MTNRILRIHDVSQRTGRGRSTIYEDMAAGTFPLPIKLSQRSVGWIESEIEDWIAKRIALSRCAKGGA